MTEFPDVMPWPKECITREDAEKMFPRSLEWISVKDIPAPHNQWIIGWGGQDPNDFYCEIVIFLTRCLDNEPNWWENSTGCGCCETPFGEVTHWMPLPGAPNV